jgi:RNA polymerase sigma factor (sigma-70 family)
MILNRKKYRDLSDNDLLVKYRIDKHMFCITVLYERYGHLVFGSCLNYLKQKENAEDVTMKLFASIGDKILKHEIQHFKSWLYQVTRNECLQFLRSSKSKDKEMIKELDIVAESLEDEKVLAKVMLEGRLTWLENGIAQLKSEQKICVELFYLHDKSYSEIAQMENLSLNTVKSAIQNGKRNLKIWMETHEE